MEEKVDIVALGELLIDFTALNYPFFKIFSSKRDNLVS